MSSKYTEHYDEWVRLYESGLTIRQIAQRYKCGTATVQHLLKLRDVQMRVREPRYSCYHSEWAKLYAAGWPMRQIAAKYGCTRGTVSAALVLLGTDIKRNHRTYIEYHDKWIELYESGLTTARIAEGYPCSRETVRKYLIKCGVIRTAGESRIITTSMRPGYDTFDTIDDELSAYYLGFIYADGCVHSDGHHISIGIAETDEDILIPLADRFGRKLSYYRNNKYGRVVLIIPSAYVWNKLDSKGIHPRKTCIDSAEAFDHVPNSLMHHFVRGFFDGDGCISLTCNVRVSIVGTPTFLRRLQDVMVEEINLYRGKIHPCTATDVVSYLQWSGPDQTTRIGTWLYKDATIYLERKYNKFSGIEEYMENNIE